MEFVWCLMSSVSRCGKLKVYYLCVYGLSIFLFLFFFVFLLHLVNEELRSTRATKPLLFTSRP